jgi:hypothetical protein
MKHTAGGSAHTNKEVRPSISNIDDQLGLINGLLERTFSSFHFYICQITQPVQISPVVKFYITFTIVHFDSQLYDDPARPG